MILQPHGLQASQSMCTVVMSCTAMKRKTHEYGVYPSVLPGASGPQYIAGWQRRLYILFRSHQSGHHRRGKLDDVVVPRFLIVVSCSRRAAASAHRRRECAVVARLPRGQPFAIVTEFVASSNMRFGRCPLPKKSQRLGCPWVASGQLGR